MRRKFELGSLNSTSLWRWRLHNAKWTNVILSTVSFQDVADHASPRRLHLSIITLNMFSISNNPCRANHLHMIVRQFMWCFPFCLQYILWMSMSLSSLSKLHALDISNDSFVSNYMYHFCSYFNQCLVLADMSSPWYSFSRTLFLLLRHLWVDCATFIVI